MKILVTSKMSFDGLMRQLDITNDNVENCAATFFISINDPSGTDQVPYFLENKKNVKVLFTHDIDQDLEKWNAATGAVEILKAFTIDQARELVDFIVSQKDKLQCIVHCAAGISRSGAVGTFINDYYRGSHLEFKRQNPHIHPNGLILRLLKKALEEREYDHFPNGPQNQTRDGQ